jgi:hypothetical protein
MPEVRIRGYVLGCVETLDGDDPSIGIEIEDQAGANLFALANSVTADPARSPHVTLAPWRTLTA